MGGCGLWGVVPPDSVRSLDCTDPPRMREGADQIQDQARAEQTRPSVQILRRRDPDQIETDDSPPSHDPLQKVGGLEVGEAAEGRRLDAGSDPRIQRGDVGLTW